MSGVIGSLELMQTVPMDVELAEYQRTAAGSARDMMRMVNDILALIELQAGKLYPRREPFSLRGLFDSLRAQYARAPRRRACASPCNWTTACRTPSKAMPASWPRRWATWSTTRSSSPPGAA